MDREQSSGTRKAADSSLPGEIDRKLARLVELQRRVNLAQSVTSEFVVIAGADGGVRFVSPSLERLLGNESVEKETIPDLIRRFSVTAVGSDKSCLELFEADRTATEPVERLYQFTTRSGSIRTMRGRSVGSECESILTLTDVTESARRNEALEKREAALATLLKNLDVGVFTISDPEEGTISSVNPAFARILGYESMEAAEGASALGHYADPGERKRTFERFLADPLFRASGVVRLETQRLRVDNGEMLDVAMTIAADIDEEGVVKRLDCTLEDITQKKRFEREAVRMEKLESLSVLSAGIAHDFNNILTVILGNVSLAATMVGNDEALQRRIVLAEEATLRARDLTQQLLTFAKGGNPIKESGSLIEVARDSCEFCLRGSNVEYAFEGELMECITEFDSAQMAQVFNNLFINANQAMADGGKLTVRSRRVLLHGEELIGLPKGRYIQVEVEDNGPGIHQEDLPRLFDPYFSTKEHGSGLGLAIAYSIVKRHGGMLEVESVQGEGTCFRITLPLAKGAGAFSAATPPAWDVVDVEGGRIIIMDDEPSVRVTATALLQNAGYEVITARNGEEAVALYKRERSAERTVDLFILDLTVPGGAGGQWTAKELHALDPTLPLLVSSGYYDNPVFSAWQSYGFAGAVRKPYTTEELVRSVAQVIHSTPKRK